MAILNDYNQLIREHFDISDTKTRKTIVALEDAEQTQLLAALSSALYDKIVQKVDQIDFGTIPRSRGDITKVEGFDNTLECLNIIRRIVIEYKENPDIVDTVLAAIENIKSRKAIFMKGYALNIEFPIVLYNLIVLAIEQSVSFLIATTIQYIKDPASQTYMSALDKVAYNNTRDNLMYEQLVDFNKACVGKELDQTLEKIIKTGKLTESIEVVGKCCPDCKESPFVKYDGEPEECPDCDSEPPAEVQEPVCPECGNNPCSCDSSDCDYERMPQDYEQVPVNGSTDDSIKAGSVNEFGIATAVSAYGIAKTVAIPVAAAAAAFGLKGIRFLLKSAIPMIRNITYMVINSRVKLSDSLAIQAQFIEANAYKLQYSTTSNLDDDKKEKVVKKQLKWAERLKKWSNTFAIDNKKAEKETKEMVKEDESKKTIDDIKDQLPPDVANSGSIF